MYIDLALETKSGKVAVLLEGPRDVSRSLPHIALGAGLVRSELLKCDGWALVAVPWHEWRLMHTEEDQLTYLAGRLEECGVNVG